MTKRLGLYLGNQTSDRHQISKTNPSEGKDYVTASISIFICGIWSLFTNPVTNNTHTMDAYNMLSCWHSTKYKQTKRQPSPGSAPSRWAGMALPLKCFTSDSNYDVRQYLYFNVVSNGDRVQTFSQLLKHISLFFCTIFLYVCVINMLQ